ncbi:TIGR03885 family FMN-dependent LLM class oxidoreductase [Stenotrophomonas maltophilia]|uniref:TIGR03885 family FMN-dependent LLM class oxidoreductase n=1 Tax=Stenotrophomonas maltophilia TaxID=40324 RepID=UPI000C146C52|nr:TIGR03885 family FMN-dependent LLM class oxidoreductase [Stenotrophomonas maltophilia]EKV1264152.1 TIGR03885 family FMN-dependent LLM class oxidoreductase [Stenotrophomonas maltophilia]MCF3550735.1 TIGR03885 family FMN-dependent LLM class oxidoreductase [Stenotrophomonas maltophilia]MCF3558867.1 TIGR03885 family FMN-dependent LLM class oxidoreductase [Stenotrophomonas maltophilia]MCF3563844.1 TIGR03885 family FMN-dependent LLM class oxidoreductase [Stenotrophomonas maltophilia]MCI1056409.1 
MTIGYHASHEQFPPATLLGLALRAEQAGFEAVMCSDHFHPWTTAQGQSGHSWVWAGALAVHSALTLGMVTCPMLRQHPALVAQAAATLEQLAPGRIWLALGTGEALNERITGQAWPAKRERQKALRDAAEVMRRLWGGEQVDHDGGFQVRQARLYSRPALPLPLLGAAVTEETARWMGGWADGLITISQPLAQLQRVVAAFEAGGGRGKPMYLQAKLSYARAEQAALEGAMQQWSANVLPPELAEGLDQPEQFEAQARSVSAEVVRQHVHVSADLGQHRAWLQELQGLGFDRIYLHNVNREQERFIDDFAEHVLPALRTQAPSAASHV